MSRERGKNFISSEITVFTEILLPKYKGRIENKRQDGQTVREKAAAWEELQQEFNALSSYCPRTVKNLKHLWDKLKKTARGARKSQKEGRSQTGGGTRDTSNDPTNVDQKVLGILGPSGVGINSAYGGDVKRQPKKNIHDIVETHPDDDQVEANDNSLNPNEDGQVSPSKNNGPLDEKNGALEPIIIMDLDDIKLPPVTSPKIVAKLEHQEHFESVGIKTEQGKKDWSDVSPRMLYYRKPEALRAGSTNGGSHANTSSTNNTPDDNISKELAWAQKCKRRRPTVQSDNSQEKLTIAKLQLAEESRKSIEEESQRKRELFELEKRKRECEAEEAALRLLKLKRELSMEKSLDNT
ncbi:hypothetical protein QAD02_022349 [Eretmocerus hayati]|uniref:Uncharacterized protein n=2 Tax=Eretmocerus hayati TaxID=131215 RepID=A0ACC2PT16_9HYME|nr:hypothetical protein QAD02_000689 [Eretmocerus hayati]KAJ8686555.1 hypothetical protein QAD02_022349 [Eretmocerus hayati]